MARSGGAFEGGGAARWSGMLDRQRGQHQSRADQFFMYNVQEMARDKEKIIGGVERLISAHQAKKARDKIKDQKDSKGLFGIGGAAGGMALGAVLAPFTGGLSLAAGAMLGGAIGGTVGSTVDAAYTDNPDAARGYAKQAQQGLQGIPNMLVQNPFFSPEVPTFEQVYGQDQGYSPALPPNGVGAGNLSSRYFGQNSAFPGAVASA